MEEEEFLTGGRSQVLTVEFWQLGKGVGEIAGVCGKLLNLLLIAIVLCYFYFIYGST